MNGDKKTGVSIMKITEKLDCGPTLTSQELNLDKNSTHGETENKLSELGANLLIKSLKNIENGEAKFLDQNHNEATYAKKITKNETKINWNLSSDKVISHIHGLSPNPGAWFQFKNERYKVIMVKKSNFKDKPGVVVDEKLTVACQSESIQILEIQREGKKRQAIKDLLLGGKIYKGSVLN